MTKGDLSCEPLSHTIVLFLANLGSNFASFVLCFRNLWTAQISAQPESTSDVILRFAMIVPAYRIVVVVDQYECFQQNHIFLETSERHAWLRDQALQWYNTTHRGA